MKCHENVLVSLADYAAQLRLFFLIYADRINFDGFQTKSNINQATLFLKQIACFNTARVDLKFTKHMPLSHAVPVSGS